MKTTKDLLSEIKQHKSSNDDWKKSGLSWKSSFAEMRPHEKESHLSWDELSREEREEISRRLLRQSKGLNEHYYKITHQEYASDGRYDPIHDEIRGYGHKKLEMKAIQEYASAPKGHHGASRHVNGLLKHLDETGSHDGYDQPSQIEKTTESIKHLSSAFNPKTTVRKAITTYGGVPKRIGDALMKSKKGKIHRLVPFTSTSTNGFTARAFARRYGKNRDHVGENHIIQYHIPAPKDHQPGNAMSIAPFADLAENEVLLHHGTRVKYSHTEEHKEDNGETTYVHHVHVLHDDKHPE